MVTKGLLLANGLLFGASVATHSFAYLMLLDPALGVPLWQDGWLAVYTPWAIVWWAWHWWGLAPRAFLLPGLLGGLAVVLAVGKLWPQSPRAGQAHWASQRELKHAGCFEPPGSSVVLGKVDGQTLRYSTTWHAFFVGRTDSGKSNTLTSTLLECEHSMLIKDDKGELTERSYGWRSQLGTAYFLAPTASLTSTGEARSDCYNPWDAIDIDDEGAYAQLSLLSEYLVEDDGNVQQTAGGRFFKTMAKRFLTGLSIYGLRTRTLTCGEDLLDILSNTSWEGLAEILAADDHPAVRETGQRMQRLGQEQLGDLDATVSNALEVFRDPRVARMTRTSSFRMQDLRDRAQPCTIYWHVPFGDQTRLRSLMRLVWHQWLHYCTSRQGGWRQRLDVVLDEVQSLHHFPLANEGLNYYRSYGIRLLILTPSMEEIYRHYGRHHSFLTSTHVQLVFGLNDEATAQKFAGRVGTHDVERTRTTRQKGATSHSTETQKEALLDATGIQKLAPGTVLLLVGEHTVVAEQAPYYRNRAWRTRSALPLPQRIKDVVAPL